MKKIILLVALVGFLIGRGYACELNFKISGDKKEAYKAGEELIVEVTVTYTHRKCELELSDTKFTYDGIKIIGATQWIEKTPGSFTRKIKVSVLDTAANEASLTVSRKCNKEGALGSFKIKVTK